VDEVAGALADAMISFQRTYDLDIVKLMPNGMYGTEDFGCTIGNPDPISGAKRLVASPIRNAQELAALPVLDVRRGARGRELECLRAVRRALGPDTPILQTVFSPLTTVAKMLTPAGLVAMLRESPNETNQGLEALTRTEERFVSACMEAGATGIFFATQMSQASIMTQDEYADVGRRYDLRVLAAAGEKHLSVVHVHGTETFFRLFADYPAQLVNWHDRRTPPSLQQARSVAPEKTTMGGLDERGILIHGPQPAVTEDVRAVLRQVGAARHVLAPGCVLPLQIPPDHLSAARAAVAG
jgi:uroporphyrinogen decarboxylase